MILNHLLDMVLFLDILNILIPRCKFRLEYLLSANAY